MRFYVVGCVVVALLMGFSCGGDGVIAVPVGEGGGGGGGGGGGALPLLKRV